MHLTNTLLITAAAASAGLAASQKTVPDNYYWSVSNWSAGCTRTCYYSFNITGPFISPYPDFAATCSGADDGAFVSCELVNGSWKNGGFPSVLSLVAPSTGDGAHLQVSLLFYNQLDGLSYNITGAADASFNAFVAPPEEFDIAPTDPLTV